LVADLDGMKLDAIKPPTLPKPKSFSLTSHRNAANPALAISLLKDLETIVSGWQQELQQVLKQIQDLYLEGPIVDGWLESYTCQEGAAPAFRHAEVDCLMNYVEKLSGASEQPVQIDSSSAYGTTRLQQDAANSGYRLCGLNEDGQLWFRHCPPEQLPAISLAIARYQRLRELLTRKQELEVCLAQLTETLVMMHSQFNR
jgi:hypothetical protein